MTHDFMTKGGKYPDYVSVMLATVLALKKLGKASHIMTIKAQVIKDENIGKEERTRLMPRSTGTILDYYLSHSRTCLQYSGDLKNISRGSGIWKLTEAGYKICDYNDAKEALDRYKVAKALKDKQKKLNKTNQQLNNKETQK